MASSDIPASCTVAAQSPRVLKPRLSGKELPFLTGRAWIEPDRAALLHNVKTLRSLLPQGCTLIPVVKASAYGHGAVLIARELNAYGKKIKVQIKIDTGMRRLGESCNRIEELARILERTIIS